MAPCVFFNNTLAAVRGALFYVDVLSARFTWGTNKNKIIPLTDIFFSLHFLVNKLIIPASEL